jgi:6-phosphofructokinase 1
MDSNGSGWDGGKRKSHMTRRLAVLTSGGDSPGMNAAVRAVVRGGIDRGAEVYAIYEGYQGMIDGGDRIQRMDWSSVGGILHRGGTIIGTARCQAFRTREGRRTAVRNLLANNIDGLVVIGGDGSLTGANILQQEWPELVAELLERGEITADQADAHAYLAVAGMVGSIDNDMIGTDMTIGADTALHRIVDAVDAIASTAASHQRAFVVEVMGRRCGYLAVMGALATAAEWAFIPELPPDRDDWEEYLCDLLREGKRMGRRDNIIIVAEGATDRYGSPITCQRVKEVLERLLGEEARITVLGHVQRGGAPSAYDRILSTIMGVEAVDVILTATAATEATLIALRNNRIVRLPLMECVRKTERVNEALQERDYESAMALRGKSFSDAYTILTTLMQSMPHLAKPDVQPRRVVVLNAGGPSPGMNATVRAAVRLAIDRGHLMMGAQRGFRGLIAGNLEPMGWKSVNGWAPLGGSELGTSRKVPDGAELYAIARALEQHSIDAILMIGGWAGYQSIFRLWQQRQTFPAFNIPMVCIPSTINNNIPAAEYSIGVDTALNSITEIVDKIKQSAVASNRCFVVEVMGRYCGYLALMSALATGAERAYLHEEGIRLADLAHDLALLKQGFEHGKRLGLIIRNENANSLYTTQFLAALFEEESGDLFDVRMSVLGHMQQGGNPDPFDRIQAVRMAAKAVEYIEEACGAEPEERQAVSLGMTQGSMLFTPIEQVMHMADQSFQRPKQQWWMNLREIAQMLAKPGPLSEGV